MTLLSHTMSQEDYAKACEDGFDPRELDQDTAVTIVDRIKAELVRSGQNIAGYTDDIDLDTLAAAVGSDTLAQSIEEQFRATDIPLTPENVDELKTDVRDRFFQAFVGDRSVRFNNRFFRFQIHDSPFDAVHRHQRFGRRLNAMFTMHSFYA